MFQAGGSSGSAASLVMAKSEAERARRGLAPAPIANPMYKKPPPPAHMMKPGDWLCDKCGEHNFANKTQCFGCHNPAPAGQPQAAMAAMAAAIPPPADMRPGDWICTACRAHNFANKVACFKCQAPNTGGGMAAAAPPADFKEGDWMCPAPGCSYHNFASKAVCGRCGGPRPASAVRTTPPPPTHGPALFPLPNITADASARTTHCQF